MTLLDELLAGRTLAVDRSALPSLAVTATMRADGVALEQLAQRTDLQPHDVAVQHVGSTAIVALTGLISDRLQLSEAANLARGLRHQRDLAARAVDQQQDVGCFRHQLLLPRPYLVLTKPLRLDIQCQRGASVKIGWKYLDD